MARRKDSPQKAAMREMMRDYLKNNDISIKDGTDVNSIICDMMSVILEGALDEELDEELGYSKYDYRNKETDNSRNGHSGKIMHTSYGDIDISDRTISRITDKILPHIFQNDGRAVHKFYGIIRMQIEQQIWENIIINV